MSVASVAVLISSPTVPGVRSNVALLVSVSSSIVALT